MKHVSVVVVIAGLIILVVGFIPLTRTITVTEEKVKEAVEYREETKYREETRTREEPYTEEITEDETREEVILRESIEARKSSTYKKKFELTAGDVIIFKFNSEDDIIVSFVGPAAFMGPAIGYIATGKSYEEKIIIEQGGEYTLTYSANDDTIIDFDIYKTYTVSVVKKVEKTKTVTYTEKVPYAEKVPYIVNVPYTEETTEEEEYTLEYLKYAGGCLIVVGLALLIIARKQKGK